METITEKMLPLPEHADADDFRADCYVLLATLLLQPPTEILLSILNNIDCDDSVPETIRDALKQLSRAGGDYPLAAMQNEFNKLFIGLGCGEIVPYASWYRGKKIQSLPLVLLRRDLAHLGIVRQTDTHEPEDHAGALCEIMALISRKSLHIPYAAQAEFFDRHVTPWMIKFFQDLQVSRNSGFYRAVGLFGNRFLKAEEDYIHYGMTLPGSHEKRRSKK